MLRVRRFMVGSALLAMVFALPSIGQTQDADPAVAPEADVDPVATESAPVSGTTLADLGDVTMGPIDLSKGTTSVQQLGVGFLSVHGFDLRWGP